MRYRPLGRTGQFVSEICLGTMTFAGGAGFWQAIGKLDQAQSTALVGRALEKGVNFIDTANVYSEGQSEVQLGQALRDLGVKREDVIVATKVRGRMGPGPNARRPVARPYPRSDRRQPEASRPRARGPLPDPRLRSGHADRGDAESARQLRRARPRAHDRLLEPRRLADHEGAGDLRQARARPVRDRPGLLFDRGPRARARDPAARRGSGPRRDGVEPARGRLPVRQVHARQARRQRLRAALRSTFPPVDKERAYDIIDAMEKVAKAHETSVARVALAWLLQRKGVMSVIIGAKTVEQLDDNLAAAELALTAEDDRRARRGQRAETRISRLDAGAAGRRARPRAEGVSSSSRPEGIACAR